jgi:hypothetical protein
MKDDQNALHSVEAMTARLRAEAPDLADLVGEDRLKLNDAIAALDQRIDDARRSQRMATHVLYNVFTTLFPREVPPKEWAARMIGDVREEFWTSSDPLTAESLHGCADTMRAMAEIWQQQERRRKNLSGNSTGR